MRVCALVNREQVKRLSKNTTIHDDRPSRHARSMLFAFCILLWQTITENMLMSSWILKPFSLLYIDFHTLHIQQYAGIFRVSLLFVVDRLSLSSVKLCRLNSIYSLEMQIKFWVKLRYIYTTRANISIFSTVCVCCRQMQWLFIVVWFLNFQLSNLNERCWRFAMFAFVFISSNVYKLH